MSRRPNPDNPATIPGRQREPEILRLTRPCVSPAAPPRSARGACLDPRLASLGPRRGGGLFARALIAFVVARLDPPSADQERRIRNGGSGTAEQVQAGVGGGDQGERDDRDDRED